ncbi:MAG: lecithin retinol acyltransferase family protein [Clostridia bacterium]|nr:lecithin retinol acyltransferase family protein [Clostridia bacterium]
MKWKLKAAEYGDMVRVKLGQVYHYGIFVSENEVIQFGPPPAGRVLLKDSELEVCVTDVYGFLCGGFMEVGEAERKEKKKRRSKENTVSAARARVGERGYNILYNNCEHFAYECALGEKYCSQTEALRAAWRSLPVLDVYVAEIPETCDFETVLPLARREEIAECSNEAVKRQKYAVWKLFEYGLKRTFGYAIDNLEFTHSASGKWMCNACEFSLSHSGNVVAVALSRKPVGVDIEGVHAVKAELAKKILTDEELAAYSVLTENREEYLSRKWTEKESLFKRSGGKVFHPSKIAVEGQNLKTERITASDGEYFLTVASDDAQKFKLFSNVNLSY